MHQGQKMISVIRIFDSFYIARYFCIICFRAFFHAYQIFMHTKSSTFILSSREDREPAITNDPREEHVRRTRLVKRVNQVRGVCVKNAKIQK